MKIKVNIPNFGERYCSDNVEYKLSIDGDHYIFNKKGTNIIHNEYGTAIEWKDGSYLYLINDKYHRLNNMSVFYDKFYVIGKFAGINRKQFIRTLPNILIPKI